MKQQQMVLKMKNMDLLSPCVREGGIYLNMLVPIY